jgi:hypothetical protein
MTRLFTSNDLIRFIYGETSTKENEKIKALLHKDGKFQKLYFQLLKSKEEIDGLTKFPSEKTIQNILDLSKSQDVFPV